MDENGFSSEKRSDDEREKGFGIDYSYGLFL